MISKMLKMLLFTSIFPFTWSVGYAQCSEWNWPLDQSTAKEKVALLQDAIHAKKYRQAIKPLNWLIANAPQLNSSIYIHGTDIYEALASGTSDPAIRSRYIDSLMFLYDLRIKNCGQKGYVLNRKALTAYKYYINNEKVTEVLPLMDSAFAVNGDAILDGTLLPFMQTIVIVQSKFKKLTEEDILSRYELLIDITNVKIKKAADNQKGMAKLKKTKKDIDELLFKIVKPDCDFVRKNLVPKFRLNPGDLVTAKRVFSYMLNGKCTKDTVWLEAGEVIFASEKDFGLGKVLALEFFSLGQQQKSEKYFRQALAIAPTRKDSSEIYFYKGALEAKKHDKIKAREYYLLAVKLDPARKEAFVQIGDLYYSSFDDCALKQTQVHDRLVYLAAYDYYVKAGNQKKMASAKRLFPSKEDIFLLNYKLGDKLRVECWILEEVVLRTRD